MQSFRELDLSFKSYLDEDRQLSLECKAYIITIWGLPLSFSFDPWLHFKEHLKNMSLILKQQQPEIYKNYPDGFLYLNRDHQCTAFITKDILKYGLLTGFWNPDGYGLPYYLDKPNPNWVKAALCANVQDKAEQKEIAKLAITIYEELNNEHSMR